MWLIILVNCWTRSWAQFNSHATPTKLDSTEKAEVRQKESQKLLNTSSVVKGIKVVEFVCETKSMINLEIVLVSDFICFLNMFSKIA